MKTYTIQGQLFTQDIMKFKQDKELILLWAKKDVKFKEIFDVDGTMAALKFLVKNDIVDDFLRIVLVGDISKIDIDELNNEILLTIIEDFFFCNKKWIAGVVSLLKGLIFSLIQESPKAGFLQNLKNSVAKMTKSKQ